MNEKLNISHTILNSKSGLKLVMYFFINLLDFYTKTTREISTLQIKKLRFNSK